MHLLIESLNDHKTDGSVVGLLLIGFRFTETCGNTIIVQAAKRSCLKMEHANP